MVYGHRHRITDCDQFTDDFLKAQGIHVNPKEPEPEDPFGDYRKKVSNYRLRKGASINYVDK